MSNVLLPMNCIYLLILLLRLKYSALQQKKENIQNTPITSVCIRE